MAEDEYREPDHLERIADGVECIAGHLELEKVMERADPFAGTRERMEQEARGRAERRAAIAMGAAAASAIAAFLSAVAILSGIL